MRDRAPWEPRKWVAPDVSGDDKADVDRNEKEVVDRDDKDPPCVTDDPSPVDEP